ncbi:hypothetical protein [Mucilaginibacter arboris]|uniref:Bulb-type lectin domain-containing protein n=1 Tax=Mucilaginibacter arboris TaxID=2682090 RepID=A0A7K1SVB1_9SPHI|nr:hypothetical protein [Mucilaginibacter arboris]MVN21289.1 hypothetical protein [Mucilaginibacter arboris]
MKNSIILLILLSIFSFIGVDNLSKVLPVSIGSNVLKHSIHVNKKAKPIASHSSAFSCKQGLWWRYVDPNAVAAVVMPRPGQPSIEYRYTSGFTIYSPDGSVFLAWQGDGNLVEYQTSSGRAIWASNTYHKGEILAFQPDNNIVIYDNRGRGVWDSGTMGYCGFTGQPGDRGATLYLSNTGELSLLGDDTGLLLGYAGTNSGSHFNQNY